MSDLLVEVTRGAVVESVHRVHVVVSRCSGTWSGGAFPDSPALPALPALSERQRVEGSERQRVEGSERQRVDGSERQRVDGSERQRVEGSERSESPLDDARDNPEHRQRVEGPRGALPTAPATLVAAAGDPQFVSFVRSAIKMFQALPLVEDGGVERFGLTTQELAVCTASHGAEPIHVVAARAILHKAGVPESALACGPHPPMHALSAEALAEAGDPPGRIHNNCSGKHAGMLALARLHGWPIERYHQLEHPVQQRVLRTLAHWSGVPEERMAIAIDGCGLPTFALPLSSVADACARFSAAARDGDPAPARIVSAMTTHPEYVAGSGRLDTDLMRVTAGRVFSKVGAEGYYCAGAPAERIGIALKVEDGAKRASEPALLATLRRHDLITDRELASLDKYARPVVLNTRGETVGKIRVRGSLT